MYYFTCNSYRHVGILYIKGTDFRIETIPLKTVRPFIMDTVCLSKTNISNLDYSRILSYLQEKVCLYTHHTNVFTCF